MQYQFFQALDGTHSSFRSHKCPSFLGGCTSSPNLDILCRVYVYISSSQLHLAWFYPRKSSTRWRLCPCALSNIKLNTGHLHPIKGEHKAEISRYYTSHHSGCLLKAMNACGTTKPNAFPDRKISVAIKVDFADTGVQVASPSISPVGCYV